MKLRLAGLCLSLSFAATLFAAEPLSLEQAVQLAVDHNRGLKNSLLDAARAEDQVSAARTRQFPSFNLYVLGSQQLTPVDFTFEKGVLGTFDEIGPVPAEDTRISTPLQPTGFVFGRVSQPLTSLIRIRRNIEALKTGVDVAREQTRAEQQKVVRDVKRLYYNLQQTQALLRSLRETLKLYQEIERLTNQYVEQQTALKADLLEVQTRIAQTEQDELTLRNSLASGKEQLNQLLGRDVLADFEPEPVTALAPMDIDLREARRSALERRPEIRQARLRTQQAQWDMKAKKAEYIPDLAVEFNSIALVNFNQFLPNQTQSVGLSLTWEPFDWGRKKRELAEKRHVVEQAENSTADAESLVVIDVNDKYRQLQQNQLQLRVARLTQETAVESLRVVKNKYATESVLLKDVLQAQTAVEEGNTNYERALLAFWDARAEFERAIGEDR
jgi:outer membrane protein TolC